MSEHEERSGLVLHVDVTAADLRTGIPGEAESCPISVALDRAYPPPDGYRWMTFLNTVRLDGGPLVPGHGRGALTGPTPDVARKLIHRVDWADPYLRPEPTKFDLVMDGPAVREMEKQWQR